MKKAFITVLLLLMTVCFTWSFGSKGNLDFKANGEDFVREGFVDKAGWEISFTNVLVNLGKIVTTSTTDKQVALNGTYLVDLKKVAADGLVLVDTVNKVKALNYQGIRFALLRADEGEYKGYSIIMKGTAKKDDRSIDFSIKLDEELEFDCKEGYVGDVVKGVVQKNKTGEVEMTFHFDHIYGDIEAAMDDHINKGSVSFEYFVQLADGDTLDITQQDLKEKTDNDDYIKLIKSLYGLGHSGEGHADVLYSTTKF